MGKRVAALLIALLVGTAPLSGAADLPPGYMAETQSSDILARSLHIHLDPDLSSLTPAEHLAVKRLLMVGSILQRVHEDMRHHQALDAFEKLHDLDFFTNSPVATQRLITLYYMANGPIVRNLDGVRVPFLPVDGPEPGGNVYPWGTARSELEKAFAVNPGLREPLLFPHSVVRRSQPELAATDLYSLDEYPVLDELHPGLRERLDRVVAGRRDNGFYAVPYSVAYAGELVQCYRLLMEAGDIVRADDAEFAGYLENRARDLLSDNYESGDASWVTGRFRHLNAQIGAYEVYDDALFGVKRYFGCSVLVRDNAESDALQAAIRGLQRFDSLLPYRPEGWDGKGNKKTLRDDIPVGVYNVIADFGQSRGTNTATILPNDAGFARKYGRTILLRRNIMTDPDLFAMRLETWRSVMAEPFVGDLCADGGFYRTLWHEIGHYLGVDRTRDGRPLDQALESTSSIMEELKADLVSLFLVEELKKTGYYSEDRARSVYASGIRRVLLKAQPQRAQAYPTMELMQFNYYLEHGLLKFDTKSSRLAVRYAREHNVVAAMLAEVFALQYAGDPGAVDRFIVKWTAWRAEVHEVLAAAMKAEETYRYAYVTYEALDHEK